MLYDSSNPANKRVAKESPPSKMKLEVDVGDTPVNFYHSSSIEVFRNIPLFFPCSVYFLWEIFNQFCHSNSWEEMLDQPKSFQERNMRVVVTTYCKQNCHNKESQSELIFIPCHSMHKILWSLSGLRIFFSFSGMLIRHPWALKTLSILHL